MVREDVKNERKNYLAAFDALGRLNQGGADVKSGCKDLVPLFYSTLHGYLNLDAAQEDHTHKKSGPSLTTKERRVSEED